MYLPKAWAAQGESSSAAQLWNECRPLMFLWLPNANSGPLERPLWQAVALCRRIKRRRFNSTGCGEGRNEDCTNCAPLRECAATALWRNGEGCSYLTEELIGQGHQVTLFASRDSITSAELVPCTSRALRLDPNVRDPIPHYTPMLDKVRERAADFDILHFHIDYLHFPLFRSKAVRTVTTLHGRQDLADHMPFYRRFSDMPLISISNAQRTPLGRANFVGTVYHGLPLDLHKPSGKPAGGYLAFLGRISPEKRPDRAIAIARAAGLPLKIAAKIDKVDEAYFREVIAPLLKGTEIEFVGEINESAKAEFLGRAAGLLFPIDWPEPFGLVMIEAMACGTPVLAFRCGSSRRSSKTS